MINAGQEMSNIVGSKNDGGAVRNHCSVCAPVRLCFIGVSLVKKRAVGFDTKVDVGTSLAFELKFVVSL